MLNHFSRRQLLKTSLASGAMLSLNQQISTLAYAQNKVEKPAETPLRIGLAMHKTGAYVSYGLWGEYIANIAVDRINQAGGVNGRMLTLKIVDDKSSPKQAKAIMQFLTEKEKCDVIIGGFIPHISNAYIPHAQELKIPYLSCSGTSMIAEGKANRYVFQPGLADEKSHIIHSAHWITQNLGRKVTVITADNQSSYQQIEILNQALAQRGAQILKVIPLTSKAKPKKKDEGQETPQRSFMDLYHRIPIDTEIIYYAVSNDDAILLLQELQQYYQENRDLRMPEFFGMMNGWYGLDVQSEDANFLENSYFAELHPRYYDREVGKVEKNYRAMIGLDELAQRIIFEEPVKNTEQENLEESSEKQIKKKEKKEITIPDTPIIPYGKLSALWETLFFVRDGFYNSDYQTVQQRHNLIETMENVKTISYSLEHPQGDKIFNGRMHQVFTHHYISRRQKKRVEIIQKTEIKNYYPYRSTDYTKEELI